MAKKLKTDEKIINDIANLKEAIDAKESEAKAMEASPELTAPAGPDMETGRTPEDHPHYKYAETLMIYDTNTGRVNVASEIAPADGTVSTVDPEIKNRPAFFKVMEPNMIANFISNFCSRFNNTQWYFFVTPFEKVGDVAKALNSYFQNPKDPETRQTLNKYRVTTDSLEKIKFSKEEIPWAELSRFISREEVENDPALLKSLMQGTPIERLFKLEHKLSDNVSLRGEVGLELRRDENGTVKLDVVTPLPKPEYLEQRYAAQLSTEDIKLISAGGTVKRLLFNEKGEMCFGCLNSATNRFHLKPREEVQVPNFFNGRSLTPEQKADASYGREFFMENCKVYNQDNSFSGKVSFDIKSNSWITRDPIYARPHIPEFVRQQLTTQQLNDLTNYRQIDASNIKKRDGTPYKVMHIDQRTNNLSYFPQRIQQVQAQQANGPSQSTEQTPPSYEQAPDAYPYINTPGRSQSR